MMQSTDQTNKSPTLSFSSNSFRPPHGILKLPQSVASTLASDFLPKCEIRNLGVTCSWMLVSLRDCSINEPISLPSAIHRLDRQQSVAGSPSISDRADSLPREHITIPNLWVGRFRVVDYSLQKEQVSESAVRLLSNLYRLVDCRKFNLYISDLDDPDVPKKFDLDPIILPPRLREFYVENIGNLISIGDFVLPSSLTKIHIEPNQNYTFACVSKVKWPSEPSKLTELHGLMIDSPLNTALSLPNGLQVVSFWDEYPSFKKQFPIAVAFPDSITDLQLPIRQDENGRYRDLAFPSALKRLVFIGQMGKEDFDLTQWKHLPSSCQNIELKLRGETTDFFEFNQNEETQPSSPIIVPCFVVQLRIRRLLGEKKWGYPQWKYTKWQLPQLQLSHATSLKSLATDTLQEIEWPEGSSFVLTALKPIKISCQEFFAANLPTLPSLQLIDFTSFNSILNIESDVASREYQRLHTLFPNLTHLVVPLNYKIELINEADPTRPMMPEFRVVVSALFYKYATLHNPAVTTEPKKTMSKNDFTRYVLMCGADLSCATDERLTMIFTKFALPQGWSNYDELTVEGFCEFYRDACFDRMGCVWSDLRVHGSHRHLIGDEFFGPIVAISRALPHRLVECRMSVTYPSADEPVLGDDHKLECFHYVNGVEVGTSPSGMGQLYRPEQINEGRFDLKPSVMRNHHH